MTLEQDLSDGKESALLKGSGAGEEEGWLGRSGEGPGGRGYSGAKVRRWE